MSTATNITHSNDIGDGSENRDTTTTQTMAVYSGGMDKDQMKQKTIDLVPSPVPDEKLPENWAHWKHIHTDEIFSINSETLFSQRNAPGTESDKKGKWF